MERELKFRVWNGAEMVTDVTVGKFGVFYVNPSNNGLDPNDSASITPFTTKYPEGTPVMQYTGMNDKHNTEIFEGDLVKVLSGGSNHWVNQKFRVYYCDDVAKFRITNDKSYPHDIDDGMGYKYFEVIGNIYANPELINKATS